MNIISQRIEKWQGYLIKISQKVHMIVFNTIALDLIAYSLRALFQSKNLPALNVVSTWLLLSLLVYDFLEVFSKGSRARIRDDALESISGLKLLKSP